jgi:quercetin dioxygenase-like cupin family protein
LFDIGVQYHACGSAGSRPAAWRRTVRVASILEEAPQVPDSDTGERVTPVLDFPSRDGLAVQAVRVDYEPGGFSETHRHPAGAYVYEPPGALHSVSRNASEDLPASLLAFFVLGEGQQATVYDRG